MSMLRVYQGLKHGCVETWLSILHKETLYIPWGPTFPICEESCSRWKLKKMCFFMPKQLGIGMDWRRMLQRTRSSTALVALDEVV